MEITPILSHGKRGGRRLIAHKENVTTRTTTL